MNAHDIYVGALLTTIECIMGGTTTVNTMYHYTPEENEAKAFADAGLRGVVGHACFSWRRKDDKRELEDLAKKWHNTTNGLIRTSVDPHARARANNSASMFEVMKTAAILHKGMNHNPTLMPAEQVLEMATIDGAKALSWENEVGSIEAGKKADLVIIDLNKPHLCPLCNEASHLVYAAKASDIETVIINGKMVLENRKLTTLNVERTMEMVKKAKNNLLNRLSTSNK